MTDLYMSKLMKINKKIKFYCYRINVHKLE